MLEADVRKEVFVRKGLGGKYICFWNEVPYRALQKGARRKKLRPQVITTLFAIVVSRAACACFFLCLSLSLSLSLIESKPVGFNFVPSGCPFYLFPFYYIIPSTLG